MATSLRNDMPAVGAELDSDTEPAAIQEDHEHRFRVYRLCDCEPCEGRGKRLDTLDPLAEREERCPDCRGEGKVRELVFEADDEQGLGVGIVNCGREGEFEDCPIGILDTLGERGRKWLVKPWLPSARNVSDAGRTLGRQSAAKRKGERDG